MKDKDWRLYPDLGMAPEYPRNRKEAALILAILLGIVIVFIWAARTFPYPY